LTVVRALLARSNCRVVAVPRRDFYHSTLVCCISERDPLDFAPRRFQRGGAEGKPPETSRMGRELTVYRTEG
jgi:hypothetical protein